MKKFLKPLPPGVRKDCEVILTRKPGERFQYYYRSHREKSAVKSFLTVLAGLVCLVIAVIFAFIPGPGVLFWFLGALLISSRLLVIARLLDRVELMAFNALQDKRKRQVIRFVSVPVVFASSAFGTYVMLFKFLPKAVVIVCAIVAAALAAYVPFRFLKEKKDKGEGDIQKKREN